MGVPYAEVIGDPIGHSKSPLIHKFWLEKLQVEADYRAVHVSPAKLAEYLEQRRSDPNWRGCNVTRPHKIAVLPLVNHIEADAREALAANCIVGNNGRLIARNTDGFGVDAAVNEAMSSVCILGSGGAARAALASLEVLTTQDVRLVARDLGRADVLMLNFGLEPRVFDFAHASLALIGVECVINATPLGMSGEERMRDEVLRGLKRTADDALVFDMVYVPLETHLLLRARELGRRTADGLTMLIAQADASFWYFFGQPAPRQHDAELREVLTR